jgi:S1-C subfamily serine protease
MSTPTEPNPEQESTVTDPAPRGPGDSGWSSSPLENTAGTVDPSATGQPTGQVPAQPTAQVPTQPAFGTPPWEAAVNGGQGAWATPGSPPPGTFPPAGPPPGSFPPVAPQHGSAPPYGGVGYGGQGAYPGSDPWGHAPWPGSSATWPWPTPPAQSPPRRAGTSILTMLVASAVVLAAVAGVLIGHAVWSNASSVSGGSASAGTPSGNSGGSTNPFGSGGPGSGQGSSASGSPADAASIAQNVDPGLVDVNTSITYQSLQGAGTGMVLTPTGEILTNNHVVEGATSVSVTDVGNGKTYNATVVGYDRNQDVAVLQLTDASGLQTVDLGNSSNVSVGEGVVAIGNANGTGGTPSYAGGSVTATDQSITASDEVDGTSEQLSGLIETNADIISGDSGGPLVNSSGQVLGMDTAGSGSNGGFQFQSPSNQGYAIPINEALSVAKLIEAGSASSTVHIGPTAFLGVEVADSIAACSGSGGFGGFGSGNGASPSTPGAAVCEAVPGEPAAQAGLASGDVITSVGGHSISSPDSLTDVMIGEKPGASVQVQYVDSSGQQQTATVTLAKGPPQ